MNRVGAIDEDQEEHKMVIERPFLVPDEVLIEILSRLPIKSIARFMSVSRKWKKILSDSYFHHSYASNKPYSVFYDNTVLSGSSGKHCLLEISSHEVGVSTPIRGRKHVLSSSRQVLVGSCNGLICALEKNNLFEQIFIYNPMTRERSISLPRHEYRDYHDLKPAYGFGCSSSTKELKVLKVFTGRIPHGLQIIAPEIFNVGIDKNWRKLPVQISVDQHYKIVFSDSAFHWITWDELGSLISITAFDVATEKLKGPIQSPRDVFLYRSHVRLAALNGNLCLIDYFPSQYVVIWKMEVYGLSESWNKIVIQKSFLGFRSLGDVMLPFAALPNGNILIRDMQTRALSSFCPKTNKYAKVVVRSRFPVQNNYDNLCEFTPMLSSIEGMMRHGRDVQVKVEYGVFPMPLID